MPVLLEHWKPVVGYEDRYAVSNVGNVRRLTPGANTKPNKILKPNKIATVCPRLGVNLRRNGKSRSCHIHHLVMAAFIGPCPEGMERNHINGDCWKNWVSNLEYVTPAQHKTHTKVNRLNAYGIRHRSAKLNDSLVGEIKLLLAEGRSYNSLGRRYGVCAQSIRQIAVGRSWTHVT